ncbi:hypothetical protein TNCV_2762091 [Trichonephila clavipes]|nr:hypothetical protein TNCV_2762091 [Trichonephila clavipes]
MASNTFSSMWGTKCVGYGLKKSEYHVANSSDSRSPPSLYLLLRNEPYSHILGCCKYPYDVATPIIVNGKLVTRFDKYPFLGWILPLLLKSLDKSALERPDTIGSRTRYERFHIPVQFNSELIEPEATALGLGFVKMKHER